MACTVCVEGYYDYGFDMPDIRKKYYAWSKDSAKTNQYGDFEPIVITLSIRRTYGECKCGSGEMATEKCHWLLKGSDDKTVLLTQQIDADKALERMYPDHTVHPEDNLTFESEWEEEY